MPDLKNDQRRRRSQARPLLTSAALAVAATVSSGCQDSHVKGQDPTGQVGAGGSFDSATGGAAVGNAAAGRGGTGGFCCLGTGGSSPWYDAGTKDPIEPEPEGRECLEDAGSEDAGIDDEDGGC